jgi:hypothetical protein
LKGAQGDVDSRESIVEGPSARVADEIELNAVGPTQVKVFANQFFE